MSDDLELLQEQFPDYYLTFEHRPGRFRYVSRSRRPGQNPYTVITRDPDELRDILLRAQAAEAARLGDSPPG